MNGNTMKERYHGEVKIGIRRMGVRATRHRQALINKRSMVLTQAVIRSCPVIDTRFLLDSDPSALIGDAELEEARDSGPISAFRNDCIASTFDARWTMFSVFESDWFVLGAEVDSGAVMDTSLFRDFLH